MTPPEETHEVRLSGAPDAGVPRWISTGAAWSWRLLLIAAALFVVGHAFDKLRVIIMPIVVALFLSTILVPPARWLCRHRLPPLLATWVVFLCGIGIVAGIIVGLLPTAEHEFTKLGRELSAGIKQAEHWVETGPLHISHQQVNSYVGKIGQEVRSNGGKIAQGAISGATLAVEVVAGILLTLVITFFFVKDGSRIGQWALGLASEERAVDLRVIGARAWTTLSGYVRGTAANGLVNATLMTIGLLLIGVPLVLPIALLTFFGGFLPIVGAIAVGLLAILVALVAKGGIAALLVLALTVVIHHAEGYLVGPLVLGRAVKLHPLAVLLSLSLGGVLAGILGAFLAVPVVGVAASIVAYMREKSAAEQQPEQQGKLGEVVIPTPELPGDGPPRVALSDSGRFE
ncbi:MAG: AI-2E family transporter [Acidimicrobiales bacterium]|nr:MAG: AI-2E family transporter [Acidimicrobiales bacterium]